MSTSGLQLQFLFIRLITYKSHLYKLRHREEVLENFRKFISQERHIRILIKGAHCFFFEDLRKKNENWHLWYSIKFWYRKYFAKKIANIDSVGVKRKNTHSSQDFFVMILSIVLRTFKNPLKCAFYATYVINFAWLNKKTNWIKWLALKFLKI